MEINNGKKTENGLKVKHVKTSVNKHSNKIRNKVNGTKWKEVCKMYNMKQRSETCTNIKYKSVGGGKCTKVPKVKKRKK